MRCVNRCARIPWRIFCGDDQDVRGAHLLELGLGLRHCSSVVFMAVRRMWAERLWSILKLAQPVLSKVGAMCERTRMEWQNFSNIRGR